MVNQGTISATVSSAKMTWLLVEEILEVMEMAGVEVKAMVKAREG